MVLLPDVFEILKTCLIFQAKTEDGKVEPTETEERGTELKTEIKEEEDQPGTSATQSSPAPGQSKKKSKLKMGRSLIW